NRREVGAQRLPGSLPARGACHDEPDPAVLCDRLGQSGLAGARRPHQQGTSIHLRPWQLFANGGMDVRDEVLSELACLAEAVQLRQANTLLRIHVVQSLNDLGADIRERLVAWQLHPPRMLKIRRQEVLYPVRAARLPTG